MGFSPFGFLSRVNRSSRELVANMAVNMKHTNSPGGSEHQDNQVAEVLRHDRSLSEILKVPLLSNEVELLTEVIAALRSMKYGSVVMTIHDGHLVEIETSVRIRKNRASR
jgi:hypothetical protein